MADEIILCYGGQPVAIVQDTHDSDFTWCGAYELTPPGKSELDRRVMEFVALCEHWHARLAADPSHSPSASEFDQYAFTPADEASMNKLLGVA